MSTMQVFFSLSQCINVIVWSGFLALMSVCITSSKAASGVRFPDDIIIFPSEESIKSKEKRNDDNYGFAARYGPEHHKYHRPSLPMGRVGHSHEANEETLPISGFLNNSVNEIPLELIQNINESNNITEFLDNELEGVEGNDAGTTLLTERFGQGEERNAAIKPKSANCMPELQTVTLASSVDASVLYIPQCTRIERCGGCCSHRLLSCQPTEVQLVSFSVVKTQYVGGTKLKVVGKEIVMIEKHTKCKCDCRVKEEDCSRYQEYDKGGCRCICTNVDEEKKCYRKNQTRLWDPNSCECICRETKSCSTGFEFDPVECKCAPIPTRNRYTEAHPRIIDEE